MRLSANMKEILDHAAPSTKHRPDEDRIAAYAAHARRVVADLREEVEALRLKYPCSAAK